MLLLLLQVCFMQPHRLRHRFYPCPCNFRYCLQAPLSSARVWAADVLAKEPHLQAGYQECNSHIAQRPTPRMFPVKETFAELGAAQCGYCTPGILLAGVALLREHPQPTLEQMKEALAGNLCRCTGYTKIYEAVDAAAERLHAAGGVS